MNVEFSSESSISQEALIERISDALKCVFGESAEGRAMRKKCRVAMEEIASIRDHRGVKSTTIAVMGSKNAGKSWLCRQLVADAANRDRIPSGEESNRSTEKATWIGPDAPPALMPEHELYIPVRKDGMVDLDRTYTLLDLPGYDDAGVEEREAALHALRGVEYRVIVISSRTKRIESQLGYLRDSSGTRILPVVMDFLFPQLETKGHAEVDAMVARIRVNCPDAEVSDVLILPRIEDAPGDEASNLALGKERLFSALRAFIAKPPVDPSVAGRVVFERLRRELAQDLREFVSRVRPAHEALASKEAQLAGQLITKILGEDPQLAAGLRMKMRFRSLADTPQWFFPFRTLFGVFTLTAGAWDRLAFAMAGSLPSLALLAFQTARNAKRLGEMHDEVRNALAGRLQQMAEDELAVCNRIVMRSIRSTLPPSGDGAEEEFAPTRFKGLERVTSESSEIFRTAVEKHARLHGMPRFLGGLATVVFAGLAAGPLWAVYREFFGAWSGSFSGAAALKWQTFPAPSAGMVFATLLLLVLPVSILALIASLLSAPEARVDAAMREVRENHDSMLERLTRDGVIRLESDDPVREAVRQILHFLRPDSLPRRLADSSNSIPSPASS
jgi:GTPase SAR1 family protein